MDTDNDNEQPNNSSSASASGSGSASASASQSASSSNNSSSSNLLVNLPMLPLNTSPMDNDDIEDDIDDNNRQNENIHRLNQSIVHPITSTPQSVTTHSQDQSQQLQQQQQQSQQQTVNQDQESPLTSDNSVFISPLLFNNSINTPVPSSASASSSSSSSSHNLLQLNQNTPPPTPFFSNNSQINQQQEQTETTHEQLVEDHSNSHQQNLNPNLNLNSNQQQLQLQQGHSSPNFSFHNQQNALSSNQPTQVSSLPPLPPPPHLHEQLAQQQQQQHHHQGQENLGELSITTTQQNITEDEDLTTAQLPPPPSSSTQSQQQQQQQQQRDNRISPTGSSTSLSIIQEPRGTNVETNVIHEANLREEVPTTSHNIRPLGGNINIGSELVTTHQPIHTTPPTSLPFLPQAESKHFSSSSSYFSHSYAQQPYHYQPNSNLSGTSCSNIFNYFNSKSINTNGSNMFGNSENNLSGGNQHSSSGSTHHNPHHSVDRLKMLYPNVNENETPLPRCWSPLDKCLAIGLSQNNLRVHYKSIGKQTKEAASVRTAHPIPPTCGIYYFEVKIVSKGKDGYMGIGLTASQFRMNRLPGWDKQTYGYHGDDGHSFSSSPSGQSYGPTFTTGDIIGCCINFVDNTCFYTKNGIDLGIAFRDLPSKLYPTVGLQTPGEEIDANFGQEPFKFDQIEDMMKQMRAEMKQKIYNFPMSTDQGDPTTLLHKLVSSYLVHNGYSQTAEAFSRTTGQTFDEDLSSIRNRQKILKLIMSGKMGQAIEHTLRSYPGLLENNKNLWFMLKCRQFIEMINGSDLEYCPVKKLTNNSSTQRAPPPNQTSVIQSTKTYLNGKGTSIPNSAAVINNDNHQHNNHHENLKNNLNLIENNCSEDDGLISKNSDSNHTNVDYINDVEMENNGHTNGTVFKNGDANNYHNSLDLDEEMEVDMVPATRKYNCGIERILEFGRELSQMEQQLDKENKLNDEDKKMLQDAFSLIAYSNPWSSPLGWQLCPTKREVVCKALNSAILESMHYPKRPPLEICVSHASELLKLMGHVAIGCCAFVNIEDVFPQN